MFCISSSYFAAASNFSFFLNVKFDHWSIMTRQTLLPLLNITQVSGLCNTALKNVLQNWLLLMLTLLLPARKEATCRQHLHFKIALHHQSRWLGARVHANMARGRWSTMRIVLGARPWPISVGRITAKSFAGICLTLLLVSWTYQLPNLARRHSTR